MTESDDTNRCHKLITQSDETKWSHRVMKQSYEKMTQIDDTDGWNKEMTKSMMKQSDNTILWHLLMSQIDDTNSGHKLMTRSDDKQGHKVITQRYDKK